MLWVVGLSPSVGSVLRWLMYVQVPEGRLGGFADPGFSPVNSRWVAIVDTVVRRSFTLSGINEGIFGGARGSASRVPDQVVPLPIGWRAVDHYSSTGIP